MSVLTQTERIKSWAYRALRTMETYRTIDNDRIPTYFDLSQLRPDETLIGIYENFLDHQQDTIVITDLGLHVFRDPLWEAIDFDQIQHLEIIMGIPNDLRSAYGIMVNLPDRAITIPVMGGAGNFRDAFEFLRFLRRVIEKPI